MELYGGQGQPVFYGAFGERNQQIFEGKEMSLLNLKFLFLEARTFLLSQPFL